mgnify:CR=1 FL=1
MKYKTAKTKNGTRYEMYFPKKNVHPENVVYYLHGGAYFGKQNWLYRYQSRYFSKAAGGATVIYLDYEILTISHSAESGLGRMGGDNRQARV